MSNQEYLRKLYPFFAKKVEYILKRIENELQLEPRITSGYRSIQEQANLYAKGRTVPGKKVTNAEPGTSYHEYGLAVDICFKGKNPYLIKDPRFNETWNFVHSVVREEALVTGADFETFRDFPHIEMQIEGLTARNYFVEYKRGGIEAVWNLCDRYIVLQPELMNIQHYINLEKLGEIKYV